MPRFTSRSVTVTADKGRLPIIADDSKREHEHGQEDIDQDQWRPATSQVLKKGEFYQDLGGDLWFCINAKQKKVGNDNVMMMQWTEDGQPVGDATEELIGSFNN